MEKHLKRAKGRAKAAGKPLFEAGRYYHLHNFGADKRLLFSSQEDFDRFEAYLYLLNAVESQRAANFFVGNRTSEIFTSGRGERLVAIGAYSFVPHHFRILVTPLVDGGIGKFMQKLQTAYTMYFNAKYARSGRLFHAAYQSDALNSEDALKRAFSYIHLDAASIFSREWDSEESASDLATHVRRAMEYRYSSAGEYARSQFVIADPTPFPQFLRRVKDPQSHYAQWMKYKDAA